jgi:diguanylate cyclase (GGDEF)-like protein
MTVLGKEIRIGASLGIATFPIDGEDIDTLMARADQALYAAKEAGRNTWRFHGHLNEDNLLPAETS